MLFQKIRKEYDYIGKDEPLKAIRDNVLAILQNFEGDRLSVIERLCMIISYIAIKSTNTFWPQSVSEIAVFGQAN